MAGGTSRKALQWMEFHILRPGSTIGKAEPMAIAATQSKIIDRGRGPEIAGTRITVFDVMDYLKAGWHRDRIANLFRLSSRDVQAAIDYAELHSEAVEAAYNRILDRHRNQGHTPDLQARIDGSRGAARRKLDEVQRRHGGESNVAENHG
jgi:uncharacterized protein (DUF433 family)